MMDMPDLPVFNIPDNLNQKKPPPEVIQAWMAANLRQLKESGQMERIRQQKSRQPADVRFVL